MSLSSSLSIAALLPSESSQVLPELVALLQDAVASGASVGFLSPLDEEDAVLYWRDVLNDLAAHRRVLLVARFQEQIVGAVQLELATKANARHRAEVQKLFVLQRFRQRGIGKSLMLALEEVAREQKRTLLVLDTRQGDTAEQLYRKLGYIEAGTIPAFALSSAGTLDATVFFYKRVQAFFPS
jgi:acetyltransferase